MDIVILDEAKKYLRVDDDSDDDFIQLCIDTSEGFLSDAITDFDTKINNTRFYNKAKLLILASVQDMYDNRQMTTKDNEKLKLLVQSFMLQMRHCTYEAEV